MRDLGIRFSCDFGRVFGMVIRVLFVKGCKVFMYNFGLYFKNFLFLVI